ncbi:hypothetical protein NS220_08420 [Microbacterium testaceum]|uniref:Uncharacterized protein n=1 Tax=Microbacterium testaceum TaxID=2033 RepID=A0A147EXH1_MICTE|nr:hypothetical protein [Microbacterium testaceum]KTR94674.1 hypothetical protein NS220_08420 [Microbacterium testaceum]
MKVIASWFYTHGPDETGAYAQVRGDVASEEFRDVYRRCIATFFATARRAEPTARLLLFSNVVWDSSASAIAGEVADLLTTLHVDIVTLPYSHMPPTSWPAAWRNQFFVFDVLKWADHNLTSLDQILVLDSDVVWTGAPLTERMWEEVGIQGALTLKIDYPEDHVVNGLSRREMTIKMAPGWQNQGVLDYSGGEFVALRGDVIGSVYEQAASILAEHFLLSGGGVKYAFEEAHVLSVAYSQLGIPVGGANRFIKRIWTQPLKPRNQDPSDLHLALWHLPAEKRYGIRRLYKRTRRLGASTSGLNYGDEGKVLRLMARVLGVPRNTMIKWVSDVSRAMLARLKGK